MTHRKLKVRWSLWLSLAILGLAAASVGRALASGSPTEPRESDERSSERQLSGPEDEKLFVPEGPHVGGQGVVEPADRETKVAAAVSGRVAKVHVKEGQRVKADEVLVELESAVERAALEAALADVERDRAELDRLKNGPRWEDRLAAAADSQAAAAKVEQTRGILSRLEKAQQGGGATGDEVDRAAKQLAQDIASAEAAAARAKGFSSSRSEDIAAALARVEASKARAEEARARLEQRVVRSPIDAEVLEIKVRAGELTQPGSDHLVTIGDTRTLRVRIDIDERDIAKIESGALVRVRLVAQPGSELLGKVVEIGRRMGRKNVRSDDPVERSDSKILEVVAELSDPGPLVIGQRVVGFVAVP